MRSYRRCSRSCAVLTMSDSMLLQVLYYIFVCITTYDEGHCNGKRGEAEGFQSYAMHVSEMR